MKYDMFIHGWFLVLETHPGPSTADSQGPRGATMSRVHHTFSHCGHSDVFFLTAKIETDCLVGPLWGVGHKVSAASRHYLLASGRKDWS